MMLLTYSSYAYAYSDYDVDGVEDSIDLCPNTPFDVLVNEKGCKEGDVYRGTLTVLAGAISGIDSETENLSNLLFSMNYQYENWDISFSTFNDITNTISNVPDTFYITTGYQLISSEKFQAKISLGTKQTSVQNDYYATTFLGYKMSSTQDVFLLYSYTYAENSDMEVYDNFHTVSVGTGKMLTDSWYTSFSYDYAGSSLKYIDDFQVISWGNSIAFYEKYYLITNYSYGLSDGASDHTISIQLGVKFE